MNEDTEMGIVRVFIDIENMRIGLKNLGQGISFERLKRVIKKRYPESLVSFNFYVPGTDPDSKGYEDRMWLIDTLNGLGYRIVECSSSQKVDNSIFRDITIFVVEAVRYAIGCENKTGEELPIRVILFSGDGDFYPALSAARGLGSVYITVVAFESVISEQLRDIADEYIDLREDKEFSQAVFERKNSN